MERVVTSPPPYITTGYRPTKSALDIWAVNGYTSSRNAVLHLSAWDIETGSEVPLPADKIKIDVNLKPNQSNELAKLSIPNAAQTVVAARLVSDEGIQLARWISWPEPLKFVRFKPDLAVSVEVEVDISSSTEMVVLKSSAPAKGVVVSVPIETGEDAEFADNFVDLVPGEEIRIAVQGLAGRKVRARWLCDWERDGFQL
jgi:beta-mannosidase